jgi:hypothetical protein
MNDLVRCALERLSLSPERVAGWLADVCCREREEREKSLLYWAGWVLGGNSERAAEYLERLMEG